MIASTSFSASRRFALAFGAVALVASTAVFAAPPVNTQKNSLFGGSTDTAINGYDTVAYFTVGKPVKGPDNLVTVRDGKLYLNHDADVQQQCLKDPDGFIKLADAEFADLLKK